MAERRTMFECETCKMWFASMEVFVRHPCVMNEANGETTKGVPAGSSNEETLLIQKRNDELISWTKSATLFLIEEYKARQTKIDSGRLTKKLAYQQISDAMKEEGYPFSADQCSSRMKTIYRAYKTVKDANSKSGNERKAYIFEKELDGLYMDKPNITPKYVESTATASATDDQEPERPEQSTAIASATDDQEPERPEQSEGTLKRKPANSSTEDKDSCKVCWEEEACTVFLDCGHIVCCVRCTELLKECPICRSSIKKWIRVFKA